jgi:hypothetical protein
MSSNLNLVSRIQVLPPALGLGVEVRFLADRDGASPNTNIVAEVVSGGVCDTPGRYISSHRKIHSQVRRLTESAPVVPDGEIVGLPSEPGLKVVVLYGRNTFSLIRENESTRST